jgi:DNA mismatch repair protein MutS
MPPSPRDTPAQHLCPPVSLLYADGPCSSGEARPASFTDLNLDQIVAAATAGREPYDLARIFNEPLPSADAIAYRQAVFRDLEAPELKASFETFGDSMHRSRDALEQAAKQRHVAQKRRWTADALLTYCRGVTAFVEALIALKPSSGAVSALADYGADYVASEAFTAMRDRAEALDGQLAQLRATILIQGLDVRVTPYAEGPDYGGAIVQDFSRFAQGNGEEFTFPAEGSGGLNMIEERILDHIAQAFPETFGELAAIAQAYGVGFIDPVIEQIDREAQFYLGWRGLIDPIAKAGHSFCYPEVTTDTQVVASDAFDLALAHVLAKRGEALVHNGFHLDDGERIIIVSGPNQGGKTTFARMFGQLHHLAALGLPVPGTAARLRLFDVIFTHFERREVSATADGKLQDELVRVHAILEAATSDSIVVLNELFASTTFRDASLLSHRIAKQLLARGVIGVWVSFLDGLSEVDPALVSMVSQVDPEDPARRTFKVERRAADGLAYARAIAHKYRLTRAQIDDRLSAA